MGRPDAQEQGPRIALIQGTSPRLSRGRRASVAPTKQANASSFPNFCKRLRRMHLFARKQVVRFDGWISPAFDETLAAAADVELPICAKSGPEAANWLALQQANVYHITAAKDELPHRCLVAAQLLERCPCLLCVSSSGAGYDTVDVAACTNAGVAVVNQAGGNAVSVAEHTIGPMPGVSRRIVESDRKFRREHGFTREDLMGNEISGKVMGPVGIGHIGTRVAALASALGMTVLAAAPHLDKKEIVRRGADAVCLDDVLARSDFVSLIAGRTQARSAGSGRRHFLT